MRRFYMVPVEEGTVPNQFGPKYFRWRFDPDPPGIACRWNMMRYGAEFVALLLAHDIDQPDHDRLAASPDVYAFPENLDNPVDDQDVRQFLTRIKIPQGWLEFDVTWHDLIRQIAAIIQLNQRYRGVVAHHTGSPWSSMARADMRTAASAQGQAWLSEALTAFNVDVVRMASNDMPSLVRAAKEYWRDRPFLMGGVRF